MWYDKFDDVKCIKTSIGKFIRHVAHHKTKLTLVYVVI